METKPMNEPSVTEEKPTIPRKRRARTDAAQRALDPNPPEVEDPELSFSRIVDRVPRATPAQASAKERHLAGRYRIIHGTIVVVRDPKLWHDSEGNVRADVPKTEHALQGDVCWFNDIDAANLLDRDIIEPVDAKPSRLGKVCKATERHDRQLRS
jgi:hypothetical protein